MVLTKEQIAVHKEFFKKADTDNSGSLTVQELYKALEKMGYKLTTDECAAMFVGTDTNKDGKITLEEFLFEMNKVDPRKVTESDLRRTFKEIDKSGDGFLDRKELGKVLVKCGKKLTDAELDTIVEKVDKDGDGQISYEEFLKAFKG
ncbi:calmodulin-like [Gigantopelta aegis]|uniref:calmodulin-like n=1 Tax=Gigantopelta aegis TaxID=1735272 RepID=UPI001B88988C|nr:calmodulin-like [Gigantopelta aegis]